MNPTVESARDTRAGTGAVRVSRRRTLPFILAVLATLGLAGWLWRRHVAPERLADTVKHAPPGGRQSGTSGMAGMRMSSHGSVQLTADEIRQFGVTFGTADVRTLRDVVRTTGAVAVDERNLVQVAPRFGGYVERLYVNQTGAHVARGEPLMSVYSPELVAAEQELLVAASLQQSIGRSAVPGVPSAPTDLAAAARRRLQLWDISDAQIDRILRSGTVQRTLTLYAPGSGVVLDKHVVQGQAIQPGETLYQIANLADVWVDAQLREADAGLVRTGARATVQLAAYPGRAFSGAVTYIYPTLDSTARTVTARTTLANPDGLIKPGMFATVRITTPMRAVLTVPSSAVLQTGDSALVFMDMGGGKLMPMSVRTGRVAGDLTEILSGLRAGQRVVTSAQFLLDSESNLAEVMKSMIGMGGGGKSMKSMPGMDMPMPANESMPNESMPNESGMHDRGAEVKSAPKEQSMPGMQMSPRPPRS